MATCGRMQIESHLSPYTKFKSEWIKEFEIKLDSLNLTEEKVENSHESVGTGDDFLDKTLVAQGLTSTINGNR